MTSRGESRIGLWNSRYETAAGEPRMYGDPTSAELAGQWLNTPSIKVVEDWGCGYGGFQRYLGEHQTYIGIDGSKSRSAVITADLADYRSTVDAIHMRHVLEHNPAWRKVLENVLASFTQRAVVTLFTPLAETETIIARYPNFCGTGVEMVDISLPEAQISDMFAASGSQVTREQIKTNTQYGVEYLFFLARDGAV